MIRKNIKKEIGKHIEEISEALCEIADKIFDYAEPGFVTQVECLLAIGCRKQTNVGVGFAVDTAFEKL